MTTTLSDGMMYILILFILAAMSLFALAVVNVGLEVDISTHAKTKHGTDATKAVDYVNGLDHPEYCRWECPDGRIRFVCFRDEYGDWAIVVKEDGSNVTAFLTESQDYIKRIIEPCYNPYRYEH